MARKKKELEIKENYNEYIIGIDLSLSDSGVAVYSLADKKIVYTGHCDTSHVRKVKKYRGYNINAIKLNIIREFFEDIKERFPPYMVIFERGFSKFKKEVEALNQVNGVVYSVFWNYTQVKYPPTSVKAEIANGKASKEQLRDVLLLNIPELEGNKEFYNNDNVSDAVGVLMTHLLKTGVRQKAQWDKGDVGSDVKKKRINIVTKKNIVY